MKHRTHRFPTHLLLAGGIIMIAMVVHFAPKTAVIAAPGSPLQAKPYSFDSEGRLIRPVGYREWVYVGTPLTPNDLNPPEAPFPEFHNVYIDPVSYAHYSETGNFREGTIIIKELVSVGSKAAVSGKGYFMGEFVGLEATIKDAVRFPNEPGNWAYFSFGHSYPLAKVSEIFPTGACNACHEASAQDDWVFTQYYPVLVAAKGGTGSASAEAMTKNSEEFKAIASAMTGATQAISQPTAETGSVNSIVPTDSAALHKFLKEGKYKDFPSQELASHPSRGPHSKFGWPVRVFLDAKTDAALKSGQASLPAGSSLVKEMYTDAGVLQGWAVMVKTQADSAGGQGWFWYETTNVNDSSDIVASGNGVPLCFGCHSVGTISC